MTQSYYNNLYATPSLVVNIWTRFHYKAIALLHLITNTVYYQYVNIIEKAIGAYREHKFYDFADSTNTI